jgi:hypothetical protein
MKRGIQVPSKCFLCKQNEESLSHIFLECDYTNEVWMILLAGLVEHPLSLFSIIEAYSSRHRRYPRKFLKKPLLKQVWTIFPFYVNRKILLAKNKEIFTNEETQP